MVLAGLGWATTAGAQVVPATPGKFKIRPLGESASSAGVTTTPPKPPETLYRQVTYIALGQPRQWRSTDGKSLLGKLIAFEDVEVVTRNAAPDPAAKPAMPPQLTVVRDGRARLLVNSRPFEIALDRLVAEDRDYIQAARQAIESRAAKPPTAPSPK